MRISKLIALLQDYQRKHGDVFVRAFNRRGDDGPPKIEDRTIFKSGNQRPTRQHFITTETDD